MKVIASNIDSDGNIWFAVELLRNTDILAQELFTQADIEAAKQQGVKEFLNKLVEIALTN